MERDIWAVPNGRPTRHFHRPKPKRCESDVGVPCPRPDAGSHAPTLPQQKARFPTSRSRLKRRPHKLTRDHFPPFRLSGSSAEVHRLHAATHVLGTRTCRGLSDSHDKAVERSVVVIREVPRCSSALHSMPTRMWFRSPEGAVSTRLHKTPQDHTRAFPCALRPKDEAPMRVVSGLLRWPDRP
jgi:hypothetical protein